MQLITIIYSNRKNILIIIKDEKIIVRAPNKIDIKMIESFVNSKANWITSKLDYNKKKKEKYVNIFNLKEIFILGKAVPVIIEGKETYLHPFKDIFYINENKKFNNALTSFYKKIFKTEIITMINDICIKYNFNYRDIKFSNAKTKWASCDSFKNLTFNWRICALNKNIIEYIIIHELCHTIEMNHSKNFWNLLKKYLPNYLILKNNLKELGFLIDLYR